MIRSKSNNLIASMLLALLGLLLLGSNAMATPEAQLP
jgi:hypothetical protein